tara:strand:+ start:2208 stop:2510 length:303 start_codon:yes stop_codon:yes gene_type:complete
MDAKKSKITTIKLSYTTKARLDKLKEYKLETYEELLQKVLETLNLVRIDPDKALAKLRQIDSKKRQNAAKTRSKNHTNKKTLNENNKGQGKMPNKRTSQN